MQVYENREGRVFAAIVARTPREGQIVELPAGLSYTNEFYAVREVLAKPAPVRVTARYGDEFCWRNEEGRSCCAHFTVRP